MQDFLTTEEKEFEKELVERLSNGYVLEYPEVIDMMRSHDKRVLAKVREELRAKAEQSSIGMAVSTVWLDDLLISLQGDVNLAGEAKKYNLEGDAVKNGLVNEGE